jgi:hypothetical protein
MSAQRPRLAEVAQAEQQRLAGDPNVVTVGYGLRQRSGKVEYEVCVQYHVRKKIANSAEITRAGSQPIPKDVSGYPTDVVEVVAARPRKNDGPPTGSRGSHIENPLIGGVSTTVLSDWHSFPTGYGTLGGLCFDRSNSDAMAISNAHVWGLDNGRDCIQPWIPVGEYVGAVLKLLLCGPLAYVLDTQLPSPLTVGLVYGAAAAWAAAAASDAEDPSRWGQRTSALPPSGAITTSETIRMAAKLPDFPFAGRAYTSEVRWDYTRHTTAGDFATSIVHKRSNEHVLVGKLVWTDRGEYRAGEQVHICAEVISQQISDPRQFFVVAVCYPDSHPDRIVYRVLRPAGCREFQASRPVCFRGVPDPLPSGGGSNYTINLDPFRFESRTPARAVPAPASSPFAGINVLELPASPLRVVFPPSTRVTFEVFQPKGPVSVTGRSSSGRQVASVTGAGPSSDPETLTLEANEMVEAVLACPAGGALLVGMCVSKQPGRKADDAHHLQYAGDLELDLQEKKDRWNIVLQVQSLNPSSPQANPIDAARIVGGIPSATCAVVCGCIVFMLLDHVFDVV